jgi:hypothetical protein
MAEVTNFAFDASLARSPFIASHMAASAVEAGVVHLAPFRCLWRAFLSTSWRVIFALTFWRHFLLGVGGRGG